jgi:hypothetical protein
MLTVDYAPSLNSFVVSILLPREAVDEFDELTTFLKSLYLSYKDFIKGYLVPVNRVDEILLWFQKYGFEYSVTDEAIEAIKKVEASFIKETNFVRNKDIDFSILTSSTVLFNFQKDGILLRTQRSAYLDADDAGLGKTIQNTIVFSNLYKYKEVDGIIIVVPNGLSYHWKYELLKFSTLFVEDDILLVTNQNKIKIFDHAINKKVLIIPIHLVADCLLSYRKDFKTLKSAKRVRWSSCVNVNEVWKKESIFCLIDESHLIKHSKAIRSKAVMALKKFSKFRACVTATPAINRIEDFYNQTKFLDNSIIPMSENAFKLWISSSIGNFRDRYHINSYDTQKVQKLYQWLQPYLIKRLKEDVPEMKAKKFPPKIINLEMTQIQKEIYQFVCKQEVYFLEEEYKKITWKLILNKLPIILAAIDNPLLLKKREYAEGYLNTLISKYSIEEDPKFIVLKFLVEKYIDNMDEKLIVYGIHPETLNILFSKFKSYNPLIIHGSVNVTEAERYEVERLFNEDSSRKIAFLSALTSSAGLNLQKGGRAICVYECPLDATHFRQLQDRTHRIVSEKDTIIEVPTYPDTIDNIRVNRAMNRAELNDKLNKEISNDELQKLLRGII